MGRFFDVSGHRLNVMGETPDGTGLSLSALARPTHPSEPHIRRARESIGRGKLKDNFICDIKIVSPLSLMIRLNSLSLALQS